ncbi:MAG: NAD(P)-dependent glycerol-1-phosphate dehydrogenase [Candidatus Bathyarchaeota archaeon]|nr:NAD(P)-dependent glycerol-1-phosphate dehydrogenase [Candidatus Bathyarchaeota archaeon]
MASPDPPKAIPVHRIDLPRIVLVGRGVLSSINGICRELGYRKALIVTGKNTLKVAGEQVQWILANDGIGSDRSIVEDAQLETVGRVMEDAGRSQSDVLIGVGGGRSIDVAKLAAAKTGKAFISVPTVASHDGIASSLASVKGMERPYTVKAVSPVAVVMDSGIIAASPYRFTAAGCGDVISKVTEVEDWKLAHADNGDYYGAYAASLALMSSQLIMESAERIRQNTSETVRELLEALISCSTSMSIAGSSRPCSGSAHLFSHALDLILDKPALHGEQCGVGSIMMARLHGLDWGRIRESLEKIGAPTTAAALGVKKEKIIEALVMAQGIRPDRYTILSKIPLNRASAEALAVETGVI